MQRFAWILLAATLLVSVGGRVEYGQAGNSPVPPTQATQFVSRTSQDQPRQPSTPTTYTLTPEQRAKAVAYSRSLYVLYFLGTLVSLGIYFFLWRAGIAVTIRGWARKVSRRHFVQCLIFVPLFAAVATLLNLPVEFYASYVLEHRFGLSTQGLASWFGDWGKSLAVVAAIGVIVAWIFYAVVRRSPRRWWFDFWLASIPLVLTFILIEPYAIEPLFYKFTPLQKTQPALVERIEAMLNHAGLSIPPARILEMDASSRTREVNAYVSGLGASKRVVVWDTTLKMMGPDELLLVLGHETGHYALYHIPKEFVLDEAVALLFFFLGFFAVNWLVERAGPRFGVEGTGDLASFPLVLVVLTLLVFLSDPLVNGISRHYEHQADQFGLEVAYGIVPDPNAAEAHTLQILGEEDLEDPDPSPFIRFWLYTHPPLDDRIRFAATYKPWAEGKPMELLPHRQ
jgi:Zn-dependent protease with chaperone function